MVGFKALSAIAAIAGFVAAHPGHGLEKRDLPTGQLITKCTKPGVVALTFDDGPAAYTEELLTTLRNSAGGHRATFFVNGNNYGYIYNYNSTIKKMVADGNQIGSHTWSHADMTKITDAQLRSELLQVEEALDNILGYHSKYLRPPYLATNEASLATAKELGYHVIMVDIDTLDWQYNKVDPTIPRTNYQNGFNAGGTISLAHDPEEVTVKQTVPWILNFLDSKGVKSVPVAECLGEIPQNWYERRAVASARPSSSALASSTKASSSIKASSSVYASSVKPSSVVASVSLVSSAVASASAKSSSVVASAQSASYGSSAVPSAKASSYGSSVSAAPKSSVSAVSAAGQSSSASVGRFRSSLSVAPAKSSGSVVSAPAAKSSSAYGGRASSVPPAAKSSAPASRGSPASSRGPYGRPSSIVAQPSARPSTRPVPEDGSCGPKNGGATCGDGECCSQYGWCGASDAYCGRGCQSAFGFCEDPSGDEPTGPVSEDGSCGGEAGKVCGSGYCCSQWGWCGNSEAHCENKLDAFSG